MSVGVTVRREAWAVRRAASPLVSGAASSHGRGSWGEPVSRRKVGLVCILRLDERLMIYRGLAARAAGDESSAVVASVVAASQRGLGSRVRRDCFGSGTACAVQRDR